MTKTYSYAKAKKSFDMIFQNAVNYGKVKIQKDDQVFVIKPETKNASPLDVKGVNVNISVKEIISYIHEGRRT